jgi:hypothetical protein
MFLVKVELIFLKYSKGFFLGYIVVCGASHYCVVHQSRRCVQI